MERIVVGVDGSDCSRLALNWAIDEARRRQARVEAVTTWHEPYVDAASPAVPPVAVDPTRIEADHRAKLDRVVESADQQGLVAPVERIVAHGRAAPTLIDAAKGADLLVVGSRGLGGFMGLLLGSVSHQVASHSPCPLVIVPSTSDD